MQNKKMLVITFAATLSFLLGSGLSFEAHASETNIASDKTVEYENYTDILEQVSSETDAAMHLASVELKGNVYQAVYCDSSTLQASSEQVPSEKIVVSAPKKVTKTYTNYGDIPTSITYEEYSNDYHIWLKGTLYLKKSEKIGSTWTATFEGTLFGNL